MEGNEEYGAVLVQPEPPKRGTFALLIPADMCWEAKESGGMVRLDFRPRTLAEKAEQLRKEGQP